ncbi:MAG TPA: hypothetical protein VJ204_11145 [Solirubrobacterales bacterium]|nr:hypothetical protein [Solirubrobacterales bacterium]
MKPVSVLALILALLGIAVAAPGATAKPAAGKVARPNCKVLLPIAKIEEVMGGAVTLQEFGKSDFIRNATTPGTKAGTECLYGTTEETANDYGIAGTVSTAFAETPKQWNAYRASAKEYPGLEATYFQPVKLGGGNQAFVLHTDNSGTVDPDVFYLYVFTPLHNMFSIDFLNGVTLQTEEGLAREISGRLDQDWRGLK